jgi:hypothetical protein
VTDHSRDQQPRPLDYAHGSIEALPVLPAVPPPMPAWLRVLRWVLLLICLAIVYVFARCAMFIASNMGHVSDGQ